MTHPIDDVPAGTPAAAAATAQTSSRDSVYDRRSHAGRGLEGLDFDVSPRVERGALHGAYERARHDPLYRPLRIYALDPSASRGDGALAVVNVPFEPLGPGPTGTLIQVVDDGLPGETQHAPLNLEDPRVLVEQGHAPSATDPHFRAQMTYAVCSITYAAFKHALGRDVSWGFDRAQADGKSRLVVRSCIEGVRNAYYDPDRGELRFGAFTADAKVEGRNAPRGIISTALIHDVVVHEMSHALLDGLRSRFMLPTNGDVLAFHEGFADLIALFQRFCYRDVVHAVILKTGGDLRHESILTAIGSQFAQTVGLGVSLRDAMLDPATANLTAEEPHERARVLLAAVYTAFTTVYARKADRLVRLATNGTGVLPPGQIPELLAQLLTDAACNLAGHFLNICIRAIDYCPPVDLTFGEYLRAVITADADLVPDDPWRYREAWIDAFRAYGIYPPGVPSLTEDALCWSGPDAHLPKVSGLSFEHLVFHGDPGHPASARELRRQAEVLGRLVADPGYRDVFGLAGPNDRSYGDDRVDRPIVESVRSSRRIGPDGQVVFDLVAEVTQRRMVSHVGGVSSLPLYGGATVIIDPFGGVRYVIRKSMYKTDRVDAITDYVTGVGKRFWLATSAGELLQHPRPFGMLHDVTRAAAGGAVSPRPG